MNKIILIWLSMISVVYGQNASLQIKGDIKNNTTKNVVIKSSTDQSLLEIPVKKNRVSGKINLPKGFYKMNIGQEYTDIYVSDGDLNFTIDLNEFDETIKYTGSLSNENNYLATKLLSLEKYKSENRMYLNKEENEFKDSLESKYGVLDKMLLNTNLDAYFKKIQLRNNRYERWQTMMMYPNYHPMFTKKENYKVSDGFYSFLTQLNINDKESVGSIEYLTLLSEYFDYRQSKISGKEDEENYESSILGKLSLIRQHISIPEIKDELVKMDYKYHLGKCKNLGELKTAYIETVSDVQLKENIELYASQLENLKEGNPAPKFTLINNKGEMKSLADYKGKYVYIDVWATWCGPCKKELPHYEEVKKQYKGKNIEFVSVCVWDKKEAWDKFLIEKKLGGEQLFNDQSAKEFTDNYMVQGVPTFVLIDKEGRLISRDAERPSDAALKTRIDKLLTQ